MGLNSACVGWSHAAVRRQGQSARERWLPNSEAVRVWTSTFLLGPGPWAMSRGPTMRCSCVLAAQPYGRAQDRDSCLQGHDLAWLDYEYRRARLFLYVSVPVRVGIHVGR